jgi:mono/diheme cytochrome c family protein
MPARTALKRLLPVPAVILVASCTYTAPPVQLPADLPTVNRDFKLDNSLAQQGEQLFIQRGCIGCHAVGRRLAGPDLFGVVERRTTDWLGSFLKNTNNALDTDPIGQALLEEYRNQRMPQVHLRDPEVNALIHYLAAESQRVRAKRGSATQ